MRELMIEAEYAPFAPNWFLETASRWFTVQKTPCLQTAEAVIGEPTLEALQNAPQLRWLQMTWAGADRYLHGGFPRGVLLTTASGAFGETIAEHAIGMLLALCRRLPQCLCAAGELERSWLRAARGRGNGPHLRRGRSGREHRPPLAGLWCEDVRRLPPDLAGSPRL